MNAIGLAIVWTALQITLIGGLTAVLYLAMRRFGPRLGVTTAMCGLGLMATAALLTFSPWPTWSAKLPMMLRSTTLEPSLDTEAIMATELTSTAGFEFPWLRDARKMWLAELAKSDAVVASQRPSRSWRWTGLAAAVSFLTLAFGAIRLLLGLVTARNYGVDSATVHDKRLLEILDNLKARLGCRANIQIHVHPRLVSAATIGWRRPMILLPRGWRSWSQSDLHAVVAHELAHIHHRDYFGWLCTQLFVVVQFYHPLAHWLAARLRLDQELAADAVAAELAGGRDVYLASLAGLALQRADERLSWSAQAFLPTRGSFLRRIEMLRETRRSSGGGQHQLLRPLIVGLLLVGAIIIVGWRSPKMGPFVQSAGAADETNNTIVPKAGDRRQDFDNSKRIALAMRCYESEHKHLPAAEMLGPDGKTVHSWRVAILPYLDQQELYDQYRLTEPWDSPHNKTLTAKMPAIYRGSSAPAESTNSGFYVFTGPAAVFDGKTKPRIEDVRDGTSQTVMVIEAKRDTPWTKPEDIPFSADQPVPVLKGHQGGNIVTFCDGAAMFITHDSQKTLFKQLITSRGGEKVEF